MNEFRPAGPMDEEDGQDEIEPAPVRRLRLLVSALMIVLIVGMITVVGALVIRLSAIGKPEPEAAAPVSAEAITLPADATVTAIGRGSGGILLVTRQPGGAEHLRIVDPETGETLSTTPIERD